MKTPIIAAAIFAAFITNAEARTKHRHQRHAEPQIAQEVSLFSFFQSQPPASASRRNVKVLPTEQPSFFGDSGLVIRARQYIGAGARQVGVRTTLWCSAFIRKLRPTSNVDDRAISWLSQPRVSAQVGAVAIVTRRGGYHVGIVSGFKPNGDPVLISGNHGNRVAEAAYPQRRVVAYVSGS